MYVCGIVLGIQTKALILTWQAFYTLSRLPRPYSEFSDKHCFYFYQLQILKWYSLILY